MSFKRANCANAILMLIATKRPGTLPPMEKANKPEDILNAILPPREWVEQGKSMLFEAYSWRKIINCN